VNSITDSGDLRFKSAGTNTVTTFLDNSGGLRVDREGGEGGTILNIRGKLTNSGALRFGNHTLSASDKIAASSLDNTGSIDLIGSGTNQALLDVTGRAGFGTAKTLTGWVGLSGDSAIEFGSGQITSLAANAQLHLNGNDAFIEDSKALGSNSALMGLASIGAEAIFGIQNNVAVSTSGSLANDGTIRIDFNGGHGGSSLTVAGTLTNDAIGVNTGALDIGDNQLSSSVSVTAKSFVNSGTVELTGAGTNLATLNVSGATTNNGSISITKDTEELAGAVRGVGSFSLSNADLQFDASVLVGQTINETGADALTLEEAQNFHATIRGFGTGDTIDAANFLRKATTYNFVENIACTGGTLTLHDSSQSLTAHIHLTGDYSHSDFTLARDHGTGTLVNFK
jgi:hypothetical protein